MRGIVLVTVLLAYAVAEFICRSKLDLWKRTLVFLGVLLAGLILQPVSMEQFLIIPLAGIVYFGFSFCIEKLNLQMDGREFLVYFVQQVVMGLALCVIYLPVGQVTQTMSYVGGVGHVAIGKNWALIFLVVIANIWFAPRLIRYLLNDMVYKTKQYRQKQMEEGQSGILSDEGAFHAGMLIGILERLMIVAAAVMTGGGSLSVSLTGFIIGTKSLARFKKFDEQEFVEYFIVGTLTSTLFALVSIWPLQWGG